MKAIFSKYISKKALVSIFIALPLGGVGGGLLSSCSDMLDTKPQGQFTADQIDESALEGLIASAYAGLEAHYFGNNEAFAGPSTNWIFDVRSDDALKGGGGTSMEENIHLLEVSEITSDNVSILNKWQNNFYAISRCNNAIKTAQAADNTNTIEVIAELKALRAWYYFDLMRIFDRIPYITEDDDASTKSNTEFTRDEIWSMMEEDLKSAYELLDSEPNKGRITKYVAAAMLAKVYAFNSDWENVKVYSEAVINSGKYGLFANFGDMSKIENNNGKESIFALQCSTANDNAHINWSNLLNCTYSDGNLYGTGDDFFYASQDLVNQFRTDDDGLPYLDGSNSTVTVTDDFEGNVDPRLDYTVGRINHYWRGHTYTEGWCRAKDVYGEYSNKKAWPAPEDALNAWPWGCSSLNFIFIRYADILLLDAEALIETATYANASAEGDAGQKDGNLTKARDLINQIRDRADVSTNYAYTPKDLTPKNTNYYVAPYPTGLGKDDNGQTVNYDLQWTKERARSAVRHERRIELALEGWRWFDLVRWGEDYLVKTMNTYMTNEAKVHPYYEGRSVSTDEIYFPVPLTEKDNSNGLYK